MNLFVRDTLSEYLQENLEFGGVDIKHIASNINGEIKDDYIITSSGDKSLDLNGHFKGRIDSTLKCLVENDVLLESLRLSLEKILKQGLPNVVFKFISTINKNSDYISLFSEYEQNIEIEKIIHYIAYIKKSSINL